MLCEKCGKTNNVNSKNCDYCGAPMPARTGCGGFGDILDYESLSAAQTNSAPMSNGGDPVEIRRLSRQVEILTDTNKKMTFLSLGAAVLALVALVASILVACSEPEKSENYAEIEGIKDDITNIQKEVKQIQAGNANQPNEETGVTFSVEDIKTFLGIGQEIYTE